MEILTPSGLQSYDAYFNTVLSISGVLFGLAFAALLFIIQSGFSSFKYSRRMFLELYVHFGKGLLISLAYLTIMPLLILYAKNHWWAINITYTWFCLFYFKALLDHQYQLGYIETLHSNKYIPQSYGKLRSYIRTITNLGFIKNIVIFTLTIFILIYPILVSYEENNSISMTEKGIFYSSILIMILTILKIKNFIPEFFDISNQELDYKETSKSDKENQIDYKVEFEAFEKHLISNEISEIDITKEKSFLDGTIWLQFLKGERVEIWINAHIEVDDVTNIEIKNEVCSYAAKILAIFSTSKVDINSIAISFHIKIIDDVKHSRNIFLRTNRLELEGIDLNSEDVVQEISKIENILFDKIFRSI